MYHFVRMFVVSILLLTLSACEKDKNPHNVQKVHKKATIAKKTEQRTQSSKIAHSTQELGKSSHKIQIIWGQKTAPITVYMYSALTCGHCAIFHRKTLQKIKRNYIDTGKVRFILRPFPLDNASLQGAKLVYSYPLNETRLSIQDKLYRKQNTWAFSNPANMAERLALATNIPLQEVKRILADKTVEDKVLNAAMIAEKKHGVNASPTFIIGMKSFDYAISYKEFKTAVEPMLANQPENAENQDG